MDSLTEYQRNLYNKLNRIVLNQKFEEDDENTKKEFQTFLGQLFEKPFLLDLFNYDQITSLCALLDTPSLLLKLKFKHDEKNDFQKFTNSLQKSIVNNPENTNFLISSSILLQNNILDFLFQHFDEHKNLQNQIDVIKQNLNKNNDSLKMLSNELNETKNNIQEDLNQKIDKLPKELNETKININININERINNFKEELKNINDKLEKTNQVQDSIHKNVCKIHPLIETVNLDDLKESGIYFIQHFEGTIGVHFPIQSTNEIRNRIIDIQHSSESLLLASQNGCKKITAGNEIVENLYNNFTSLRESSENADTSSEEIKKIIEQQTSSFEQIVITLRQLSDAAETFSVSTQNINTFAENLCIVSEKLKNLQPKKDVQGV